MRKIVSIFFRVLLAALVALPVVAYAALLTGVAEYAIRGLLYPFVLAFCATLLPGRVKLFSKKIPLRLVAIAFVAVLSAVCIVLFHDHTPILFCAAAALVLTPLFERVAGGNRAQTIAIQVLCAGGCAYVVAGVATNFTDASEIHGLLAFGCVAFLCASAFFLNSASVLTGYSAQKSAGPSARVARANTIATLAFIAIAALILRFDQIQTAVRRAFRAAFVAIVRFVLWLMSLFPMQSEEVGETAGESGTFDLGETAEPSRFAEILKIVFLVIVGLVVLYLLIRAAPKIYAKIRRAFRAFMGFLRRYAQSVGEAYRDEGVSLFDVGTVKKAIDKAGRRVNRFIHRERYDKLNDRERVRYIVRALYRKSKQNLSAKTLREAVPSLHLKNAAPEDLVRIYESVRYGEETPNGDEVKRLKREAMV